MRTFAASFAPGERVVAAVGAEETILCILGMHRSGTSLTTGLLRLMGLDLGPAEHLAGAPHPEDAAFAGENVYLVGVNDLILSRLGGSWDRPPPLPRGWERGAEMADLRERAAQLLSEELGGAGSRPRGWKDPRNTLTLPFWRALVPGLRCVLCVRHPLAVAASLAERDGFSPQRSLRLWWLYNRVALRHLGSDAPGAWLAVHYEDYFSHPEEVLAALAGFLGLVGREGEEAALRARRAIQRGLCHHVSPPGPDRGGGCLSGSPAEKERLPLPVGRLYARLRGAPAVTAVAGFTGSNLPGRIPPAPAVWG